MTTTLIHQGPAYELSLAIEASPYGYHLKIISFVPIARNPEHQARFEAHLSREELEVLHGAIGRALGEKAVRASRSVPEPAAPHAGTQAGTTHPPGVAAAVCPAGEPT